MPRPAIPLLVYVSMAFDKLPGFMQIIYINVKKLPARTPAVSQLRGGGRKRPHPPRASGFVPDEKINQIYEPRFLEYFYSEFLCASQFYPRVRLRGKIKLTEPRPPPPSGG